MASAEKIQLAKVFITNRFGYSIQDLGLVAEAMDTTGIFRPGSNKRLAIVGDAALKIAIAVAWYPTGAPRGIQKLRYAT